MYKEFFRKLFIICIVLFVVFGGIYKFSKINLLKKETVFKIDVDTYIRAELRTPKIFSRLWMNYAMEIAKHANFAPASAARFYAYVATVYADVLEVSNEYDASVATASIINTLVPDQKENTNKFLAILNFSNNLSSSSLKILEEYQKRSLSDKYDLVWDKKTPEDKTKWYIRNDKIDKGANAGEWSTWLLSNNDVLDIPTPPVLGSLQDKLELEKVKYAVHERVLEDEHVIYFWHGSTGFEKGANLDNVTPAGVWQNILYTEFFPVVKRKMITDKDYAYSQKILAQSISDAFIKCWQVKYQDWTQRPSMRINKLDILVADPPFPSFVSGHSTISATAATVLSALYPEKKQIWMDNLTDARNSRLMAGLHFDTDNKSGEYLGRQIGEIIVKKIGKEVKIDSSEYKPNNNYIVNLVRLGLLKLQPLASNFVNNFSRLYHKYFDRPLFKNVIATSGIEATSPSTGTSFADYDNDGDLDLFVAGHKKTTRLYRNDGLGKFTDVTAVSKIQNDRTALVYSGIFGDYDNDGCLDLFMTGDLRYPEKKPNTWLYHNNCNGTFTDVTTKSGIYHPYHGRGSSWVDFDNDGYLDIYVVNQGHFNGKIYFYEPNIFYRNNGNGTFTDITSRSGADGFIGTFCRKPETHTFEITGRGFKASLQPIWFDYNDDNLSDLFIATDSGVSPLYKNNGDGTFTNVTLEAGLCKPGTGMGVTVGDYDNDGDMDIYVTNVGGNYLWENNGNGTFTENAKLRGVGDRTSLGWGTGFFDYDNDGYLDLYIVNGDVIEGNNEPEIGKVRIDRLYHNLHNKMFKSVADSEGIKGNDSKEGATFGDFDNNGFLDLFVVTGRKELQSRFRLYQNRGNNNHWVTIQLVGNKSNKDAVGAKITIISGGLTQIRQVVSGSSFLSQTSLWQTFGLGKNKKIDEIKIVWPSGVVQNLSDIKVDQKIKVLEP